MAKSFFPVLCNFCILAAFFPLQASANDDPSLFDSVTRFLRRQGINDNNTDSENQVDQISDANTNGHERLLSKDANSISNSGLQHAAPLADTISSASRNHSNIASSMPGAQFFSGNQEANKVNYKGLSAPELKKTVDKILTKQWPISNNINFPDKTPQELEQIQLQRDEKMHSYRSWLDNICGKLKSETSNNVKCRCPYGETDTLWAHLSHKLDVTVPILDRMAHSPCSNFRDSTSCNSASNSENLALYKCKWHPFLTAPVDAPELAGYGACINDGGTEDTRSLPDFIKVFLVHVSVAYGWIPVLAVIYFFLKFIFIRTVGTMMRLFLIALIPLINEKLLKIFVSQRRPPESCSRHFGMPSGHSATSMGMLFFILIDLYRRTNRSKKVCCGLKDQNGRNSAADEKRDTEMQSKVEREGATSRKQKNSDENINTDMYNNSSNNINSNVNLQKINPRGPSTNSTGSSDSNVRLIQNNSNNHDVEKNENDLNPALNTTVDDSFNNSNSGEARGRNGNSTSNPMLVNADKSGNNNNLKTNNANSNSRMKLSPYPADSYPERVPLLTFIWEESKNIFRADQDEFTPRQALYWSTLTVIVLLPVPISRVVCRDHSAMQIALGGIVGGVIAILFNMFIWYWMRFCTDWAGATSIWSKRQKDEAHRLQKERDVEFEKEMERSRLAGDSLHLESSRTAMLKSSGNCDGQNSSDVNADNSLMNSPEPGMMRLKGSRNENSDNDISNNVSTLSPSKKVVLTEDSKASKSSKQPPRRMNTIMKRTNFIADTAFFKSYHKEFWCMGFLENDLVIPYSDLRIYLKNMLNGMGIDTEESSLHARKESIKYVNSPSSPEGMNKYLAHKSGESFASSNDSFSGGFMTLRNGLRMQEVRNKLDWYIKSRVKRKLTPAIDADLAEMMRYRDALSAFPHSSENLSSIEVAEVEMVGDISTQRPSTQAV